MLRRHLVRAAKRVIEGLLWFICFVSVRDLCGDGRAVVSLTTYGARFRTVHLTLTSIGMGKVRPARVILWIDDPALRQNLTPMLRRLVRRGLEIRACENWGPHKKYFPYLAEADSSLPLVTADDDVFYPRSWLARILQAHENHPSDVVAYRVRRLAVDRSRLLPYSEWTLASDTHASVCGVAIGVSGVLYPPAVFAHLTRDGSKFMTVAPFADDLWLHSRLAANGVATRQVLPTAVHFMPFSFAPDQALASVNQGRNRNDEYARHLYDSRLLSVLSGCSGAPGDADAS